jgi:hypothetical protein
MKLLLIHLADMFDNWVLQHRFYWVCQSVGKWWGDITCHCWYCRKFQMYRPLGRVELDAALTRVDALLADHEDPKHTGQ